MPTKIYDQSKDLHVRKIIAMVSVGNQLLVQNATDDSAHGMTPDEMKEYFTKGLLLIGESEDTIRIPVAFNGKDVVYALVSNGGETHTTDLMPYHVSQG